jgi:hypothetical protein
MKSFYRLNDKIWHENNNNVISYVGFNFEELKLGRVLEKHAKAPWNILIISACALIQRDVQERRGDKVPTEFS